MMRGVRNPKAEGRGPKQGRNPKSEIRRPSGARAEKQRECRGPKTEPDGAAQRSSVSYFSAHGGGDGLELLETACNPAAPQPLGERTSQFGEAIIRLAK